MHAKIRERLRCYCSIYLGNMIPKDKFVLWVFLQGNKPIQCNSTRADLFISSDLLHCSLSYTFTQQVH